MFYLTVGGLRGTTGILGFGWGTDHSRQAKALNPPVFVLRQKLPSEEGIYCKAESLLHKCPLGRAFMLAVLRVG